MITIVLPTGEEIQVNSGEEMLEIAEANDYEIEEGSDGKFYLTTSGAYWDDGLA